MQSPPSTLSIIWELVKMQTLLNANLYLTRPPGESLAPKLVRNTALVGHRPVHSHFVGHSATLVCYLLISISYLWLVQREESHHLQSIEDVSGRLCGILCILSLCPPAIWVEEIVLSSFHRWHDWGSVTFSHLKLLARFLWEFESDSDSTTQHSSLILQSMSNMKKTGHLYCKWQLNE